MSYIFWKLLPRPSPPDPTNTHSTRPQPIHLVPQLSYSPLKFENHQFPAIVNHTMSYIFWKQLPRPVQLTKNPFNSSLVGVRSLTLQLDKDPFLTSCFASLFLMWSHLLRCTSRTALMSGWHASWRGCFLQAARRKEKTSKKQTQSNGCRDKCKGSRKKH